MKKLLLFLFLIPNLVMGDLDRGYINFLKIKTGEISTSDLNEEELMEVLEISIIINSASDKDEEDEDVDGACYDGYRKCKKDCPSSVYDWETSEYLYKTDANSKCEDACKKGKRACEYENTCNVSISWQQINILIRDVLDGVSLKDLLETNGPSPHFFQENYQIIVENILK